MRKSISLLLCFALLSCLSFNLYSQSVENELDQKELTKQFIGKWLTDWSDETVTIWEVNPVGNGYEVSITWKNEGRPDTTDKGLIGFTSDGLVAMLYMWSSDGTVSCDYGKFVSADKITVERYDSLHGKVRSIFNFEIINPAKIRMVWIRWGPEGSTEDAEVIEKTWTKMNQ